MKELARFMLLVLVDLYRIKANANGGYYTLRTDERVAAQEALLAYCENYAQIAAENAQRLMTN